VCSTARARRCSRDGPWHPGGAIDWRKAFPAGHRAVDGDLEVHAEPGAQRLVEPSICRDASRGQGRPAPRPESARDVGEGELLVHAAAEQVQVVEQEDGRAAALFQERFAPSRRCASGCGGGTARR